MPVFHRNFMNHSLNRRLLVLSAKRHKNRSGTNGRVKAFRKSAFGADIEISGKRPVRRFKIIVSLFIIIHGSGNVNIGMLGRTVGIQKLAADVYDRFSVPVHDKTWLFRDRCNHGRL